MARSGKSEHLCRYNDTCHMPFLRGINAAEKRKSYHGKDHTWPCGRAGKQGTGAIATVTQHRREAPTSGQLGPKSQGLGKALPNKQFLRFGRRAKSQKYASVNTLALLAG
jgi:hypothetical protein